MSSVLSASILLAVFGASAPTTRSDGLPADWPPLPDFKTYVDYIGWWEAKVNAGASAEAGKLYAELFVQEGDSEALKKAKRERWGEGERRADGMFTGEALRPERYAWDPGKHPDWEKAYQVNDLLRPKVLAWIYAGPRPLHVRPPSDAGDDSANEKRPGNMINVPVPSRSNERWSVQILLQNAWRAPGGVVDVERVTEAVEATVRSAQSLEQTGVMLIDYLCAMALRDCAYDSAMHLLWEAELTESQLRRMDRWMARHDRKDIRTAGDFYASELTGLLDAVQYVYFPFRTNAAGVPQPNQERVRGLVVQWQKDAEAFPKTYDPPLDVEGEIGRYDPRKSMIALVGLFQEIRRASDSLPPQEAWRGIEGLVKAFKESPSSHVLFRQLLWDGMGRVEVLAARTEAKRRATRLLYRLHLERARNGAWASSLEELRGLPRVYRTDPFSGKGFVYRVKDGEPVLYSVGENGVDDDGVRNRQTGDLVYWPIPKDGR
jgi:hypothetical protein